MSRWRGPNPSEFSGCVGRPETVPNGLQEVGQVHSVFDGTLSILWYHNEFAMLHGLAPLVGPFDTAVTPLPQPGSMTPGMADDIMNRILLSSFVLDGQSGTMVDIAIRPADYGANLLASALAGGDCKQPSRASGILSLPVREKLPGISVTDLPLGRKVPVDSRF